MSQSPGPPPDAASADWRASVAQATRSAEVRAVADILAKMEHGATPSSKLMLAMRFEEDIFQKATSLLDYQKRIQKRLKKFTKNYKATAPSPIPASTNTQERLLQLQQNYRDKLMFVCQHADAAIQAVLAKNAHETDPAEKANNIEKAKTLKQHTDNAKVWATNLGVLQGTTLNTAMDSKAIDGMQTLLEHRLDNIRNHVLRFANPDLFIQEMLQQLEEDMKESTSHLLAAIMTRRLTQVKWHDFDDAVKALEENLHKAQAIVPPPNKTRESQRAAALQHLERMRAAAQAVLAFLAVPNKEALASRDVLHKCHLSAMQTLDFLAQVMPEFVDSKKEQTTPIQLQDAWTRVMEYPHDKLSSSLDEPSPKRAKTTRVISSRVLLTPGRKTPSNLLAELKRKGARLVRPLPNGEGTFLIMEFGNAFFMTIYLVPLLVTIRAFAKDATTKEDSMTWTPVHAGLEEGSELHIWGVTGTTASIGHVVQSQLEYASAQATSVLRKFFSNTIKAKHDFEVEISEGTALLQFLQLARTTYSPNFTDLDL